ncbi:hypothetical protein BC828DRAFT_401252 [Blastocladiella britannica]|nr:hypothetical protein BC828DRAFT_401252 [Blastocladiella britannica]
MVSSKTIIVDLAMQHLHLSEQVDGIASLGKDPDTVVPAGDSMCLLSVEYSPGLGSDDDHLLDNDTGAADGDVPHGNVKSGNKFAKPGDGAAANELDATKACRIACCLLYTCQISLCNFVLFICPYWLAGLV